jgi:anthraniloyl-CoA monooxygenase
VGDTSAVRIVCVGGGPAGIYFAVLAKRADPARLITVYERNRPEDTFGFGVVFSDATMGFLAEQDRATYPEVLAHATRWDPITVRHGGRVVRAGGVGFAAVERRRLLEVLREQARALGVELVFERDVPDPREHLDADLVVGSDGVNSGVRSAFAEHFRPRVEVGPTRFSWLGTDRPFDSLTFFFEGDEHGCFGAHVYPYRPDRATFIVETDEETYRRAGIDAFSEADTIAYCERLFAAHLDGHRLLANRSSWQRFRTVRCASWRHGRVVLLGDAAHTAHFSVGSGTKMAMEDGLALSQALDRFPGDVDRALVAYEDERRPRVAHVQAMARSSFDWWAGFARWADWAPERFSFHFLTRSQFRYDTLASRDPAYVGSVERTAGVDVASRLIAVEPAEGDLDELARLAAQHPLALTRLLPVSEDGRIGVEDGRLDDYAGLAGRLPLGAQLGHAGPRGACLSRRRGLDRPLSEDSAWPLQAASALPYGPGSRTPRAMDAADMERVRADFARAARRASELGFRFLQLHFGHGYLLATFISPLTNLRDDEHGGPLENRMRFPLAVLDAARAEFAGELAVAVSATDWQLGGLAEADLLAAARLLRAHGADFVTALGGQTTPRAVPPYGRCFQALLAGKVQTDAGVPAIAAGGVADLDDARTILLAGRAERCLLDSVPPG